MRVLHTVLFALAVGTLPAKGYSAISGLICNSTAVQAQLRAEGITERLGDIVFNCQGDVPGGDAGASFSVFVNAPVTNRLDDAGFTDATISVAGPAGPIPTAARGRLIGSNAVIFENLAFTLPPQGIVDIRISNIRANANGMIDRTITALVSTNGISRIVTNQPQLTVGFVRPGLLMNVSTTSIFCAGSPLPEGDVITLLNLYETGTRVSSLRVTEGTPNAFEVRQVNADTGTRIVVSYFGFPAGSRVFVPDAIGGSTATQQSSAGDLGVPRSVGRYTPGLQGQQLLLIRVRGADARGTGGALTWAPPFGASDPIALTAASEVPLSGGTGVAVYEVFDSAPSILESALIPTFLALPQQTGGQVTIASAKASFGPLSTVTSAHRQAPIPRFSASTPPIDCTVVNDCNASYFPKLFVDAPALTYTAPAGVFGYYQKFIRILNDNGGQLVWSATVKYKEGGPTDWLKVSREVGINNASIMLDAHPENLPGPGVYEATLVIDAGPLAGTQMLPVTLTATQAPPVVVRPTIDRTYNPADNRFTTLVPGSRAVIEGTNLSGAQTQLTIDSVPAKVLNATSTRVEFVVPEAIGPRTNAQLVYTAASVPSAASAVVIAAARPIIYPNGVLNQNGIPNAPQNGEMVENVLQIFATGLPTAALGTISVKVHDRDNLPTLYAGPAPGLEGIQQVNVAIPADLPAMNSEVVVCGTGTDGVRVCSPGVVITIER
ncbi:MAG TPA: hypothetical protein VFB63_28560 [Bryobacteraceae bacterium]|nr:hypothetical protein [Bryobacteraceae bacterium]